MTDAPDETSTDHEAHETHDGEAAAPDDVREQMRLALERKNNKGGSGGGGGGGGPSGNKASAATENSKHQREFRRKSGG